MWMLSKLSLVLIAILASSCGPMEPEVSDLRSDSKAKYDESYEQILGRMRNLAAANPSFVSVLENGTSMKGLPLLAVRLGYPAAKVATMKRPVIYIDAAIHGNEYLGFESHLPKWFVDNSQSETMQHYFRSGGSIVIVPVVNADGFEYHRKVVNTPGSDKSGPDGGNTWGRMNANKIDLNRTFPTTGSQDPKPVQQETQWLMDLVDSELAVGQEPKLELTYNFHCCLNSGGLLWPYMDQVKKLAADVAAKFSEYSAMVKDYLPATSAGKAATIVGYTAPGVSGDYFYDKYKAAAFVYEGSSNMNDAKVEKHAAYFEDMIKSFNKNYQPSLEPLALSGNIKVRVVGDASDVVQMSLAAEGASRIQICQGDTLTCQSASANIVKDYAQSVLAGPRRVFAAQTNSGQLSLAAKVFTFIATLDSGAKSFRTVELSK